MATDIEGIQASYSKLCDKYDEVKKEKEELGQLLIAQHKRIRALEAGIRLSIKYLQGKLVWGRNEGLVHRKLRNLLNEGKSEGASNDS